MLSAENDALKTEVESLKRLLVEASADVELARRNHFAHSDQAAEIERLRLELEMSQGQLHKSQSHLRFLEEQMNLFDKESIEYSLILSHRRAYLTVQGHAEDQAAGNGSGECRQEDCRECSNN